MFYRAYYLSGLEEYCLFETFEAECPNQQVILMTEARYGLMTVGKCVNPDSGRYIMHFTNLATMKVSH